MTLGWCCWGVVGVVREMTDIGGVACRHPGGAAAAAWRADQTGSGGGKVNISGSSRQREAAQGSLAAADLWYKFIIFTALKYF